MGSELNEELRGDYKAVTSSDLIENSVAMNKRGSK